MKIAIPTKGDKGLEDSVSDVFGRSERFTILEIADGSIVNVEVVENPAASYKHGAGPHSCEDAFRFGCNRCCG